MTDLPDIATTRADFDRIALLDTDTTTWNHNNHYHNWLLQQVPAGCQQALDVGCGAGDFARVLAEHSTHVLGLDLSPEMIRLARERSDTHGNLTFEMADILQWPAHEASYNYIVSIATLHHMHMDQIFPVLRSLLAPGGRLVVLDLYTPALNDYWLSLFALPASRVMRLWKNGRIQETPEARAAWDAHGQHDHYPTLAQVRQSCATHLPGARVRRHLFWRYSLVWQKPW